MPHKITKRKDSLINRPEIEVSLVLFTKLPQISSACLLPSVWLSFPVCIYRDKNTLPTSQGCCRAKLF